MSILYIDSWNQCCCERKRKREWKKIANTIRLPNSLLCTAWGCKHSVIIILEFVSPLILISIEKYRHFPPSINEKWVTIFAAAAATVVVVVIITIIEFRNYSDTVEICYPNEKHTETKSVNELPHYRHFSFDDNLYTDTTRYTDNLQCFRFFSHSIVYWYNVRQTYFFCCSIAKIAKQPNIKTKPIISINCTMLNYTYQIFVAFVSYF